MQAPAHFLVVEDDAVIRRAVGRGAKGLMEVRFAETGMAAIDALRQGPLPRFVLLDYMLPDLNGLQVLRHLREDPRCADLPVVVFSSIQDPRRVQEAIDAGADAWVSKPDDPQRLHEAVRSLCAQWGGAHAPGPARATPVPARAPAPYSDCRYRLLWGTRCVAGAGECGQLGRVTEARDDPDGHDRGPVRRVPGRTRYLPVLLNDIVTHDDEFDAWAAGEPGASPARRDLRLEVRGDDGTLLRVYRLAQCWPSSYEGSPLGSRPTVIHALRLEHEGWHLESNGGGPPGPIHN